MSAPTVNILPHPDLMSWPEWAAYVVGYNNLAAEIAPDLDWPAFADRLSLIFPNVPRPDPFARWQEWAEQLRVNLMA